MNLPNTLLLLTLKIFSILFLSFPAYAQYPSTNLYSVKLLKSGKDTLVAYDFLEKDFVISTQIEFNYPQIKNKRKEKNSLRIFNDSISITIKETSFNPSNHILSYKGEFKSPYGLEMIDGEKFYGTDGEMPVTEIESIAIEIAGVKRMLDPSSYRYLFNPNFQPQRTNVYLAGGDRMILSFWGSDGAGGYLATMFIRKGEIEKVIVNEGF